MSKRTAINRFTDRDVVILREHGGQWLREQRLNANLKQRQISDALDGMETAAYISVIEKGGPNLPEDRWEDYAQILGLDWDYFCEHMLLFYKPSIYSGAYKKNPLDIIKRLTETKERVKK